MGLNWLLRKLELHSCNKKYWTDMFVKPPDDIKKPGVIWRLKKPLYGLDDTSWMFWLKVKEVLMQMGLKVMDGDKAFYFIHKEGVLKGAVITNVDNFNLTGTEEFIKNILEDVDQQLTVSKVKKDKFRLLV